MFTIPATNKLLPDPLPDYYDTPQYTLVFEMTDLLVHPEWSVRFNTFLLKVFNYKLYIFFLV